jgi:hypothetical protein
MMNFLVLAATIKAVQADPPPEHCPLPGTACRPDGPWPLPKCQLLESQAACVGARGTPVCNAEGCVLLGTIVSPCHPSAVDPHGTAAFFWRFSRSKHACFSPLVPRCSELGHKLTVGLKCRYKPLPLNCSFQVHHLPSVAGLDATVFYFTESRTQWINHAVGGTFPRVVVGSRFFTRPDIQP